MTPFDDVDKERMCKDEAYFRGNMTAQIEHLHKCAHRIEESLIKIADDHDKRITSIEKFQLKATTLASIIATSGAFILNRILKPFE